MVDKPLWGDGTFEFARWETPFENTDVEVMEIAWGGGPLWHEDHKPQWAGRSLFKSPFDTRLTLVVRVHESNADEPGYPNDPLYFVTFQDVSAFRVLDEGGLLEFWRQTESLGRSGGTTFRVRNHQWSRESLLAFLPGDEDGWSYVIATGGECVEVVARDTPEIAPAS